MTINSYKTHLVEMRLLLLTVFLLSQNFVYSRKLKNVFSWKQISYNIDGVLYDKDSDSLNGKENFIQYNNVPIGFEVYKERVFVTVPRRRFGIPSTLNIVTRSSRSPALTPYPGSEHLVSVYRPRIDVCGRLWMVDTGLLEVPGNRSQLQKPAIVVYDLKTDKQLLKYELKDSDLVSDRSSGGLTSITVDVTANDCDDAFAYINDLATNGIIVFSLKARDSWRVSHPSFAADETALNFTVAGYPINWKDGVFSIALSGTGDGGTAYFHPLASLQEYSISIQDLKDGKTDSIQHLGTRGKNSQSGSHDYHRKTKTLFFANVAQDAILCWNVGNKMAPENIGVAVQDHKKLVYISDLKVIGDEVWVLVNQMPRFIYSVLNTNEDNYFIFRSKVDDLIRNTVCEKKLK
ncbi:L-dopachrome tautomerase yellow-f2-like [Danaus plexippus]|uniref:L-dopachrome tautomerase yellow-f2-like n=1 Tax=Danaus plexippus TaxID=13037 RepID=UPI002AB1941E|nr:L-dopachrome tautomerase yellow-f2-like [Danaus plexippus]